jgi:hypothetical protein
MTRKTNAQSRAYPIVLKSIIRDAIDEKTIVDDNAKRIRAKLRVALATSHIKNTSWIATNSREYDAIRCAFDNVYATRIANARKRNTKSRANVDANVDTTNVKTNDA